jgi:hypothetical protein
MPTVYNGGQSPLEYYAIHGNPDYPGTGREAITNSTKIGTNKYPFTPYKNPDATGNANDKYSVNHTRALADDLTPYNGKGTADGISQGTYQAIFNYKGGSVDDIYGTADQQGSGRNKQVILNAATWGYGPKVIAGDRYVSPDTSLNKGQVYF